MFWLKIWLLSMFINKDQSDLFGSSLWNKEYCYTTVVFVVWIKMVAFWLHGQNGCFLVPNFPQSHCQKYHITLTLRWKSAASLHHVLLRFNDVRIYVSQLLFLTGWVVLNAQYPISVANKPVGLKAESLSIFISLPRFSIFPSILGTW